MTISKMYGTAVKKIKNPEGIRKFPPEDFRYGRRTMSMN